MSQFGRFLASGALLLVIPAWGTEPGAPLEASKQELQKLQSKQKAGEGPDAKEGLRPNLPQIQGPVGEALPPIQPMSAERMEKETKRQKDAQRNWLVRGIERLEKSERGGRPATDLERDDPVTADGLGAPDLNTDPEYLLKVYNEQKQTEKANRMEAQAGSASRPNPFAPFLQGWLGNSPVRGQFFDATLAKGQTGAVDVFPGRQGIESGGALQAQTQPATPIGLTMATETKANPYLSAQDGGLPILASPDLVPGKPLAIETPAQVPFINRQVTPANAAPPFERANDRKAPAAPMADDQKYFPQLKKF